MRERGRPTRAVLREGGQRWSRRGLLALAVGGGLLACNLLASGAPRPTGSNSTLPEVPSVPTAAPVIASFDASEAAWQDLHEALDSDPATVLEQARAALASPDAERRFPAVYALGLIVEDGNLDILRPVLDDPELALRTIAAGALIGLGEAGSLPVLIEAMGSDEVMPFSHPPLPVWILADSALAAYTGIDFGIAAGVEDQRQASAAAWRAWWEENGGSLTWDGSQWRLQP